MPSLELLIPRSLGALDWSGLAIEISLKATLLLVLAALANLLLWRRSASLRHWVWCTALATVLLLPAALLLLPDWSVRGVRFPAAATVPTSSIRRPTDPVPSAPAGEAAARDRRGSAPQEDPAKEGLSIAPRTPLASKAGHGPPPFSLARVLVPLAWAAGAIAALLPMVAGRLRLRRLTRRARPLTREAGLGLADEAMRLLGIRRAVRLLESEETAMPMSFGIRRPCVLLPASSSRWPRERLRAVLLHEMAHVRRWDCLTQTLAQLCCSLLWFHPGVWYASRCLRIERERACDDYVLNAETRAADYAGHLLEVVRSLRDGPGFPFGAVAFARPSQFEGRLLAVLDPRRSRSALGTAPALRIAVASCAVFVALAALKPWVDAVGAGEMRLGRRLVGGASELVRVPDSSRPLEARWAWAQSEAARRPGDYWVGYGLPEFSGQGDGVLSDTEGIDLDILDDSYRGPTMSDVLAGCSVAGPRGDRKIANRQFAVLLHVSRKQGAQGEIDRIRAQTLGLPAEIGNQPLFWLGESDDEQSIAWLKQVQKPLRRASLRAELVNIISLHRRSVAVVPYLRGVVAGQENEEMRAQAVEGLARHPGSESFEILSRAARSDRSRMVRLEAVEALGEIDMEKATDLLIQIARSREDREIRTQAVEALGRRASETGPGALEVLAVGEGAPYAHPHSEKPEAAPEEGAPPEEDHVPGASSEDAPAHEGDADRDSEAREAGFDADEVAVQRQAVESLGHMDEAVSLRRLMAIAKTHPVGEVRRQAVESIGHLGTDGALAALRDVTWKNRDVRLQREAVESLQQFPEEKVVSELIHVARSHPRVEVRLEAIESLGSFSSQRILTFLGETAGRDRNPDIQREAMESLSRLPEHIGTPTLIELAKTHPDPEMRREAIEQLGHRDPERALPVIEEILGKTPKRR